MTINSTAQAGAGEHLPWYRELTGYHWWVLSVATLGWLFDSMDQRLFVLARTPALRELLPRATDAQVADKAAMATAIFILGWATGGLIFGMFGDRWGRTRTMMITILIYSLFTGLSAFSTSWWDFAIYRFLCGTGIGGEYAAGVALVAEVMPTRARPYCLGLLQGLAALGQVAGSLVSLAIGPQAEFEGVAGWRLLFLVGILPSLLVVIIRWRLREPESWVQARELAAQSTAAARQGIPQDDYHKQMGDLGEMFRSRQLLFHTLIGMTLGVSGQIGLWGIGFWTPELIRGSQRENRQSALIAPLATEARNRDAPISERLDLGQIAIRQTSNEAEAKQLESRWRAADDRLVGVGTVLQDLAGMCGIYAFTFLTVRVGRRLAFAVSFVIAYLAVQLVFGTLRSPGDVYWMIPLLGFCVSSVYGGFAIYFPELFPTRLRSTGTGFCYNVARYVTAFGPLLLGKLTTIFAQSSAAMPLRYAAMSLASIYFVGLFAIFFAPETHGKPLPE